MRVELPWYRVVLTPEMRNDAWKGVPSNVFNHECRIITCMSSSFPLYAIVRTIEALKGTRSSTGFGGSFVRSIAECTMTVLHGSLGMVVVRGEGCNYRAY